MRDTLFRVSGYGMCICMCVYMWCVWVYGVEGEDMALRGSPYFRLLLVSVVWKTLEADMRFSMY